MNQIPTAPAAEPTLSRRHALDRLMRPASVAIVGASDDPSRIGGRPLQHLRHAGFAGAVYPVNPNRQTVQGWRSYPDVRSLPAPVDAVILAIPARQVIEVARACADLGCGALIVFSADFAETGEEGRARQAELQAIARASGMRVVGPNCIGVFNVVNGFYGSFTQIFDQLGLAAAGPVGIVSQSGAYGNHLAYLCREQSVGICHSITTGNECDVDVALALDWMVRAPEVEVVLLYAETVRDGPAFVEALREAQRRRKPVIMMKVGGSAAGGRAAASHTAALAGNDAIHEGVLRQFGVLRARSTEEMIDLAAACVQGRYPGGRRVGILSMSGGVGIQMADAADRLGLDVAPFSEDGQAAIRALVPYAGTGNPIDLTATVLNDPSHIERALEAVLDRGGYDAIIMFVGTGVGSTNLRLPLLGALRNIRGRYPERVILLAIAGPDEVVLPYREMGYLVCKDVDRGLLTLRGLAFLGQSLARAPRWEGACDRVPVAKVPRDEFEAKRLLAGAGIPSLQERVAGHAGDVAHVAAGMGERLVLKILSPDIAHKTEVGGVVVGLGTPAEAQAAATAMLARVRDRAPEARISGFLLAPMCEAGVEVICGALRDPTYGPVVMVGMGGTQAELIHDVAFRLAPFPPEEGLAMLADLRMRPLLDGFRGAPASDVEALAEVLSRLSRFIAATMGDIAEIDINPLMVLPEGRGCVALDALLVPASAGAVFSPG